MGFLWLRTRLAAAESETYLSYVIEQIAQTILTSCFSERGENPHSPSPLARTRNESEFLTEVSQLC